MGQTLGYNKKGLANDASLRDRFDILDEQRAPNVMQYMRGVRNYYILSGHNKVSYLKSLAIFFSMTVIEILV